MVTPEGRVKAAILRYLEAAGIWAWNSPTGAAKIDGRWVRFGTPGSADIIGVLPGGRFLAVECKRPKGGRLSCEQAAWLARVRRMGGVAFVARDTAEVAAALRDYCLELDFCDSGPVEGAEGKNRTPGIRKTPPGRNSGLPGGPGGQILDAGGGENDKLPEKA
ncbi:MAG: VRR-NUC domain-containing protein [Spirochaetaceae bacterium]|jgi:hypothetical protein|nr:VRR-NUC domain-containing protein [Spirochaetaceae bacterium]